MGRWKLTRKEAGKWARGLGEKSLGPEPRQRQQECEGKMWVWGYVKQGSSHVSVVERDRGLTHESIVV